MAVFGVGGVGLSAVLIGVAVCNAKVIAVDTNKATLAKALALGAWAAVDVTEFPDAQAVRARVRSLCKQAGGDEEGADLSVDAAGFQATCENAVWCARRGLYPPPA
jgi:Zn-dependent alcohol dehydrogenase